MCAEWERVRTQGWSVSEHEPDPGIVAIAAPIFNVQGGVEGVLALVAAGGICTMMWWVSCLIKKVPVMKCSLFSLIIGEQSEEAKHRLVSLKGEISGAKCKRKV
jgi:hypothetical protein